MKNSNFFLYFSVAVSLSVSGRNVRAQNDSTKQLTVKLVVSAAASTKDALREIQLQYRKKHENVDIAFNFGSSGALQKQIENGAPVDVFLSAARKNVDELAAQNLVEKNTIRVVVGNRLVLIVPSANAPQNAQSSTRYVVRSFKDLARDDVKTVAIGAPQGVPAGKYAQQVLTKLGIWQKVLPKAVQGKDVRAVLTQVEMGNVDAGIVYQSDAATSRQVRVIAVAPSSFHTPIQYAAAVVKNSRNAVEAQRFAQFLSGATAHTIWKKFRFVVLQ